MKLASALYQSFYPFLEMDLFSDYKAVKRPDELDTDDCLVVWGGGDISPSLYKREVSPYTHANKKLSLRDFQEWELMKQAKKLGIPIIGICRGAQMQCALAGGFLIQDVTGHGRSHPVVTQDGETFTVSSLHHQMLNPFETDHVIIAKSARPISDHYIDVKESVTMPCEPEFVWFPKDKGVAIQWHPEFMDVNCLANQYVKKKIQELIL